MLLSETDQNTTVRSFHAWSPEFAEQLLDRLSPFGFRRHENTIEAPVSRDWVIERKKGTPFSYRIRGEPIRYNPCFTILFRGRLVASIRVTVYGFSTAYAVEWKDDVIPRIRDFLAMREVEQEFPEFLPSVLEFMLMG